MISLKTSDIPFYMHGGSFYFGLNVEDGPEECFASCDAVNDIHDLKKLVAVTAFWGLHQIPLTIIHFCYLHPAEVWSGILLDDFAEVSFAQDLIADSAAFNGRAECLQYLLQLHCPAAESTCQKACLNGHLDCLKLLHSYHVPWNIASLHGAAGCGHLNCLQYLHRNGCPWNVQTTQAAAEHGQVHTLRYAIENGCLYNKAIVFDVKSSYSEGKAACLQYLFQERGLKIDKDDYVMS